MTVNVFGWKGVGKTQFIDVLTKNETRLTCLIDNVKFRTFKLDDVSFQLLESLEPKPDMSVYIGIFDIRDYPENYESVLDRLKRTQGCYKILCCNRINKHDPRTNLSFYGVRYYDIDTKTGQNVKLIFEDIIKSMKVKQQADIDYFVALSESLSKDMDD